MSTSISQRYLLFPDSFETGKSNRHDTCGKWAHQLRDGVNLSVPCRVLSVLRFDVCFDLAQVSGTAGEGARVTSFRAL